MYTKIYITLIALLFMAARGDPDPQTFIASTPGSLLPSPSQQPQYEDKSVVVYLTPEQITALQTGQGVLEQVLEPQTQPEDEQQNQEQISQFDLEQGTDQQNDFIGNQRFVIVQNQEEQEPESVNEPSEQEPQGLSRYSSGRNGYKTSNSERNKYNPPTPKQMENNRYNAPSTAKPEARKSDVASSEKPQELDLKSYNYYSVYNEKKGDNINIKIIHPHPKNKLRDLLGIKEEVTQKASALSKYEFVPYAYVNNNRSDVAPIQESNQRSRTSQKSNERQYAVLFTPAQSDEQQKSQEDDQDDSNENEQNDDEEVNESNYESSQNERKQILDLLKKQNAQAEAANVGKRPVVIKKVSITKQVPIPQPYIIRVPQPVVVKVPQPYAVPLEITRQAPIEREDSEQDVARQANKVKKTVRVPATKKVYVKVDKPILVERIVPVGTRREVQVKPQKLRILGSTWKY